MPTLEPLAYYKLKAQLLHIAVQESQLQLQANALLQQKLALLSEAGLPAVPLRFEDETCTIAPLEPPAAPEAAPEPVTVPAAAPADALVDSPPPE